MTKQHNQIQQYNKMAKPYNKIQRQKNTMKDNAKTIKIQWQKNTIKYNDYLKAYPFLGELEI